MEQALDLSYLRKLLDEQAYEDASCILNSFTPANKTEQRIKAHFWGKILFHQEKFEQASYVFRKAIDDFGEHVGLLSDLLCCHYVSGDYFSWSKNVDRLAEELEKASAKLSTDSLIRTMLLLAKSREEQGLVADALQIYEEMLKKTSEDDFLPLVLAQLVRIKSFWGIKKDLPDNYNKLILINEKFFLNHTNVEVQHALILAEMELFGVEEGSSRLGNLLTDENNLCDADKRLLIYDYLECNLRLKGVIPEFVSEYASQITFRDDFEDIIHRLTFDGTKSISRGELSELSSKVPPTCFIRVMIYLGELNNIEIQRKLLFLLDSLEHKSRKVWTQRFRSLIESSDTRNKLATYDSNSKIITFGDQVLNLSRKKMMWGVLEHLLDKGECPIEEFVEKIWQVSYNPSYYHRLRVLVKRLNDLLKRPIGVNDIIAVTAEKIYFKHVVFDSQS